MDKPKKLVVFDVEGVIIPKRRFLLFEISRKLSFWQFTKIILIGILYEIGLLSLEKALKKIFKLLEGSNVNELLELFEKVPLMPTAEEVFKQLKKLGIQTVLISSGLPTLFVKKLADRLHATEAVGFEVKMINGRLTGEIEGEVLKPNGKAVVLKKILENKNFTKQDCAIVADDRNNLPMFSLCSLNIACNPDFLLTIKSDHVITNDLTEILPLLTSENKPKTTFPLLNRNDVFRETIHIGSFSVAFLSIHFGQNIIALVIFVIALFYIMSELARISGFNLPIISTVTWKAAVKSELYQFTTAPIFFAFGIILTLILFPTPINYASITILTFGDGFATIFGKLLGKTKLPYNKAKNLEGSFFGFLFAFFGALAFLTPMKAFLGALTGIIIESLPLPINDNITIPIASALTLIALP
jgi:HAD superfamily phosphoserine phosphatase-like hydrolase